MPDSGLYSNVNLTLTISCSEKFSTLSPPPMYLFLSPPSQPLCMQFGLQRKPFKRDGSLQGFNKSSFLQTQGGRLEERLGEGEEGRVLQGRKPLPNNLDGHLLCQGCPILPVILVKGIFNGHH